MKKRSNLHGGRSENAAKSKAPLHRQIREALRQEILSGERPPYSEMPSEQEIAQRFNTTRMTVRQAITTLEIEGMIEKQQGKRTVVCPPKEVEPIFALPHDNQSFFRPGEVVQYILLHQDLIPPPIKVREKLQLHWTVEKVIRVSRVRLLHHSPVSVYSTYLPYELCPELLKDDISSTSLVYTLRTRYGLVPRQMTHELEVHYSDEEISALLKVRERTPILQVESIEFDTEGKPFSFNEERFRADRYRFKINMSSSEAPPSPTGKKPS